MQIEKQPHDCLERGVTALTPCPFHHAGVSIGHAQKIVRPILFNHSTRPPPNDMGKSSMHIYIRLLCIYRHKRRSHAPRLLYIIMHVCIMHYKFIYINMHPGTLLQLCICQPMIFLFWGGGTTARWTRRGTWRRFFGICTINQVGRGEEVNTCTRTRGDCECVGLNVRMLVYGCGHVTPILISHLQKQTE